MSKRFSTLDTTRLLFEHPKILFRMIERMDYNTLTTRPSLSKGAKAALMMRAVAGKVFGAFQE